MNVRGTVTDEASWRIGLRVEDVPEAATFYQGLGFEPAGSISHPDGRTVMAILRRGDLQPLPSPPPDSLNAACHTWFS